MPRIRSAGPTSKRGAPARLIPARGTTASDMIGLMVIVLAVALAVTLLMPSNAPVASAVSQFLVLSFGRGALLVPVALLMYAATFFVDDGPLGTRVALGLALCVTAILSLVSLNAAGEGVTAELVVATAYVGGAGGYLGGGVAWGCLTLVGRNVGNVLLVGLLIAGAVICGFSISDTVARIRGHAHEAGARLESAREAAVARRRRLRAERAEELERSTTPPTSPATADAVGPDGHASFIGIRKTSVLRRMRDLGDESALDAQDAGGGPKVESTSPDDDPDIMAAETALLATPGRTQVTARVEPAGKEKDPAIPSFLRQASEGREVPAAASMAQEDETDASSSKEGPSGRSRRRSSARGASGKVASGSDGLAAGTHDDARRDDGLRSRGDRCEPSESLVAASVPWSVSRPGEHDDAYELPPLSMLSSNPNSAKSASSAAELEQTMSKLQSTLIEFGLSSRVVGYVAGPLVTTFHIEMGEGERVSRITNLEDDIALTLAAESVRIFAPIPGTSRVGIEIPNKTRQNVHLGDVLPSAVGGPLEFAIGRDAEGHAVTADLAAMPHLLVAGATGSGKSVMINSLIMSLLMRTTPRQVRLILVDPKRVEFSGYNGLPHLYVPVVTEPRQAAGALQWAVSEMERRLKVFEHAGARNIGTYNEMCVSGKLSEMDNPPEPMPLMVIIIDELSDLMMVAGKDVEASIVRIAQLARAAGIHLVLATQRPSANVVTGLIKSNIETRVALSVASGTDSRVILDATGAQRLLGHGDMLFKARGNRTRRILGCFVSDEEIESVVDFIRSQGEPDYHEEILTAVAGGGTGETGATMLDEDDDPLVWEAARIVVESQLGSTSGLQRRLKVGYARAGRIMDMLESKGVVGPSLGSKPRDVLLDEDGLEELRLLEEQYRGV